MINGNKNICGNVIYSVGRVAHMDECSILKVPDVCSNPSEAFGFFRVYQCPVNTGGRRLYAVLVTDELRRDVVARGATGNTHPTTAS